MPVSATSQLIYDGFKTVVMQFTGVSSDAVPEINVAKVDCSELNPPAKSVAIQKMQYDVSGGIVQLSWAADDPVPFALLADENWIEYDSINGMTNPVNDGTGNGDILLTTLGFEAGSNYMITIEMRKKL